MEIADWIPTTVLALVVFLARNVLITRLKESVRHEFETKLENVRDELRAKNAEIAALRDGPLATIAARKATFYERCVAAVDQLWSTVNNLRSARYMSEMLASMKYESAVEQASKDTNLQDAFKKLSTIDPLTLKTDQAHKAEPFLSPAVWAAYSAFSLLAHYGVVKMEFLKRGLGSPEKFFNRESLV